MLATSTPTIMVPLVVCPVAPFDEPGGKGWSAASGRRPTSAGTVTVWPAWPAAQPGSGMTGPGRCPTGRHDGELGLHRHQHLLQLAVRGQPVDQRHPAERGHGDAAGVQARLRDVLGIMLRWRAGRRRLGRAGSCGAA